MKKFFARIIIIIVLLAAWTARYLAVNQGRFGAYHDNIVKEYKIGDIVSFGANRAYNIDGAEGYDISVNSAQMITVDEFCNKYHKTSDDFVFSYDNYLEIETTIYNTGSEQTEFFFAPLMVKGVDWHLSYLSECIEYANADLEFIVYGQIVGINIPIGTNVCVKMIYGFPREKFVSSRWQNIKKEKIWFMVTTMPVEQKIKIEL